MHVNKSFERHWGSAHYLKPWAGIFYSEPWTSHSLPGSTAECECLH